MDYMLFKDLDGKYLTLKEYVEANLPEAADETPAEGEQQTADVVDTATGESITDSEDEKEPVFCVSDPSQLADMDPLPNWENGSQYIPLVVLGA